MSSISFINQDNTTINFELAKINLIRKKQKIVDFNIELTCPTSDYKDIEEKQYFHLQIEMKSPLFLGIMIDELPLKIKLRSSDNIRRNLLKQATNEQEIREYLVNPRSITEEDNQNNNHWQINDWYCLEVKQKQDEKTIGYSTLWHKLAVKKTKNKKNANQKNFWTEEKIENMSAEWEKAGDKIGDFFDELIETLDESISEDKIKKQSISDITKQFFFEDNWNYLQLNAFTLQLNCQGKNGQINCYACCYDEQNQLIFYSLYPMVISEEKRPIVAELITKINYGMIMGNLELDFIDGELRYKTSIDVEGDRLSTDLVKRLVYTNVLTMDEYLPVITAVINQESTIDEAIKLVE